MDTVRWSEFTGAQPELARQAEELLGAHLGYLATVRPDGWPRVHPLGVHFREGTLRVEMLPTSPKGKDLLRNGGYALHCTVEDPHMPTEVLVTGLARLIDQEDANRVWFELLVGEVLYTRFDLEQLMPVSTRWKAS